MWQFVAERYQDREHVVAYNLMVEPHPEQPVEQEPLPAAVWNDLAQRITAGIREVDENTPIIVDATVWANPVGFAELEPTGDDRTIYSFHLYEPFSFTHQGLTWAGTEEGAAYEYPGVIPSDLYEETRVWDRELITEFLEPVRKFQQENDVPIFVGEFGCHHRVPSCVDYLQDLFAIFDDAGWGHTFYIWRDDEGFDYAKGVEGDEHREDSEYLQLFRDEWLDNDHFSSPSVTTTLKELAADHGIRIGSYYDYGLDDATHDGIFAQEFNAMTVGFFAGVLYPDGTAEPVFAEIDAAISLAVSLDMEILAQSLVWFEFEEIPAWIQSTPLGGVEAAMFQHIDTVVNRYADRINLWNVVNEAIDDEGHIRLNHKWAQAMGSDYIAKAFTRAHAADPTAVLYYNEFDIESNTEKYNAVKTLLKDLLSKGVPVHALGWQLHVTPGSCDAATLLTRFNEIADLGLDNYITELDVELPPEPTADDYEAQKQTYKMIVETFLAARRHQTLIFWGLRDGSPYWLTDAHPLLFDEEFNKKPAYFGVEEALLGQ
jgi:GH35 family endo-1,4-beta-xylanase